MVEAEMTKETMGMIDVSNSHAKRSRPPRKAIVALAVAAALALAAVLPGIANAAFEPTIFDGGVFADSAGDAFTQAAGHPYEASNTIVYKALEGVAEPAPDGNVKDIHVDLPPGFVGNPLAVPYCSEAGVQTSSCPVDSQVGVIALHVGFFENLVIPVFNMVPPPGSAGAFGFNVAGSAIIHLNVRVRSESDYGLTLDIPDISQTLPLFAQTLTFWGNPSDPSHDAMRGPSLDCFGGTFPNPETCEGGGHAATTQSGALLTLPSDCAAGPLTTTLRTDSWQNPADVQVKNWVSHLPPGFPAAPAEYGAPSGVTECGRVPFDPSISVRPTTDRAETPTGLNVSLSIPDTGFTNPEGISQANLKKAVVRLPAGMSINPSVAEGLGVCTPADYSRETANSEPGAGCPNSSKIGTVQIVTPALADPLNGSLYIAQQNSPATTTPGAENPFDSLLALYIVARNPERGVLIKQAGQVIPDPATGQLVTTFDNNPQLPFSQFNLSFREGQRSPLVSPPGCGTYSTEASFVPWSAADPGNPSPAEIKTDTSSFRITEGVGGAPCPPSGGARPFHPNLRAGTLNNAAGAFSPFSFDVSRNDGEQEITHFSIKLPPGLTAKLAGIPFCSEAGIQLAHSREHEGGGAEELAQPSCPAGSAVGRTLVGAGVGSVLTYVPGKVYLAGPYNGSQLSIVAITSAKVGPFDLGTVVIREALKVNPETAEVFIDPTGSDPIPHIIDGIPVYARDIRVYVDRPDFVLNPTSCKRTSTASTILGSGANFASEADNQPVTVTSPFQAASCASLGFAPKLALSLKGGTKRNANPAFKAVVSTRKGDANIGQATVTLPHSEFLDQGHIKTVCTRVQFNAGAGNGSQCPAASIYGRAKAVTPLLSEPLSGPVYLRSSSHRLPDLVAALHSGEINIDLDGRIDSAKGGRIRNTFEAVPDAPVTTFTLEMFGGKKSLLVNSTNLCVGTHRAIAEFTGQNGKAHEFTPPLKAKCGGKKGKGKKAKG
jgi:hypothetical protein